MRIFSKNSSLLPSKEALGPFNVLEALTRSCLIDEIKRANTDSVIIVNGIPNSSALIEVHLPVPFCPAVSRIFQLVLPYHRLIL